MSKAKMYDIDINYMKSKTTPAIVSNVIANEVAIFSELKVRERLSEIMKSPHGLKSFAEAFYFVRVSFVKLNFIVGSRCSHHEVYWGGLARNLFEELGGECGPSHNELYRWFLKSTNSSIENRLKQPKFALRFDQKWENYCAGAPIHEALAALAIYEIYDNPDYAMLYEVVKQSGIEKEGLIFFGVHANAEHFELFESMYNQMNLTKKGRTALLRATTFVSDTQKAMWSDLLTHLESATKSQRLSKNSL